MQPQSTHRARSEPLDPTSPYAFLSYSLTSTCTYNSLQKTPEFNSFINSGVAYVNGTLLFASEQNFATFRSQITAAAGSSASSLVPSQYSEVIEGYKAIHSTTVEKIYPTAGLIELLLSINSPGMISVQAALQQPMRFVL